MTDKDELVARVRKVLADRANLSESDLDAAIADLHELAEEHALARDSIACAHLFANKMDAFHLGILVGETYPRQTTDALTGEGKPIRVSPPLPVVEQRPGPHADDWQNLPDR